MPDMNFSSWALLVLFLLTSGALAQDPMPSDMELAKAAATRFPQPVVVGSLLGNTVLQPLESQPVLGHVAKIVRSDDGALKAVMSYGGFFGIGSRLIAVPVDAMVLLGDEMEVVGFKPAQLNGFPTFDGTGTTPVAPTDTIRIGLARPTH